MIQRISVLILFLTGGLVAPAQTALSLEEAIARGLENNYDIRLQREQHEVAELNNTILNTGMFPQLTAGLRSNDRYSTIDNTNNPFTFFAGKVSTNSLTATPFVQLNWRLFNGLRGFATRERLDLLEEQSMGNVELVVENTVQAIILAYFQAVLQQERLAVLRDVSALSRDRLRRAEDARAIGVEATFDVLQLRRSALADSVNVLNQEVAVRTARRQLQVLLGAEGAPDWVLSDGLDRAFAELPLADLEADMLEDNQNLRNQFINLRLQENQVKQVRGDFMPTLDVQGGWDYAFNRTQVIEPDQLARSTTLGFFVNFALQFNLFNGGQAFRSMEEARIQEAVAELSVEQMSHRLRQELRDAHDLYQARLRVLRVQDQLVDDASLQLELARDRLDRGLISSLDFRDVQLAALDARLARLQTLYDLSESRANLLQLTGGILAY